ncbi:MAG: hypothetical protein ACFFBP_20375 [Promethearchaeota archaeon]
MHELVFFGMIILSIIRLIGVIISVDFYYDSKSKTYIYFCIGWGLWALSLMFLIFSGIVNSQTLQDFFQFVNYILGPIAILFILAGISSYYLKVNLSNFLTFLLFLIIFPLIVFFTIGLNFVYIFSRIFTFLSYIIFFLLPIVKLKNFKEKIGKSIRWYYLSCFSIIYYIPLSIILSLNGDSYGLYQTEDMTTIILAYIPILLTTILLIAFMIHLEYNISYQHKKDLKDKYSHDLGNILQAIESAHFIISSNNNIDKENILEAEDIIKKKFREASETLKEIRKL